MLVSKVQSPKQNTSSPKNQSKTNHHQLFDGILQQNKASPKQKMLEKNRVERILDPKEKPQVPRIL